MVHAFTDIAKFEIRVSWNDKTTGYVNGILFQVVDEQVTFPNHPTFNDSNVKPCTRSLVITLRRAVHLTPEFANAKRESRSSHLAVTNGNFPGVYSVQNPLNGSVYNVVLHPNKTFCECADHNYRKLDCKHIKAVKKHIKAVKKHINKALEPKLKLRVWNIGKPQSMGKLKAIYDYEITDEMIANAKASLGW